MNKSSYLQKLLVLFCLLILASCSSVDPDTIKVSSWENHLEQIKDSNSWGLSGRLNIRQDKQSDTINLRWQQIDDSFEINLNALGLGNTRISGNQEMVRIEKNGDAPVFANNLEEISAAYIGYIFPLEHLKYWVRGIPDPSDQSDYILNENGTLASLIYKDQKNGDWELEYDRYSNIEGLVLPGRVILQTKVTQTEGEIPYRLTFLINDWTQGPAAN